MNPIPRYLDGGKGPGKDHIPSVFKQVEWSGGLFDFGKAGGPGIRHFNPALIHLDGEDWLYARRAEECKNELMGINRICAFKLDPSHNPVQYQLIRLENRNYKKQHFEDPRIGIIGGNLWLSFTTFQVDERVKRFTGAHQGVAILDTDRVIKFTWDPIYGKNGGSIYTGSGNEKNWLWFEHNGAVHLLYMTQPHEIIRWEDTRVAEVFIQNQPIPWKYGQPRGGTNPIRIGNEYWSFFHGSSPWKLHPATEDRLEFWQLRYHMGAYCFDAKPPFRIKWMTPEPLLSGSHNDPWQDGLPLVVFPCGAIFRQEKWFVSFGINDYCSGWMEIPHGELEKKCRKVQ